jgi:hypothetical protein
MVIGLRVVAPEARAVDPWQWRDGRHLGLVNLGLTLQGMYKTPANVAGVYCRFSDLAQSDHRILVVFDVDRQA